MNITINRFKKELLMVSEARPRYNVYLYVNEFNNVLQPKYDFNFYNAEFYNIVDFLHKYSWHLDPSLIKQIYKVSRDRWEKLFERDTLGVYEIKFRDVSDLEPHHTIIVTQDIFFCPF